MIYKLDIIFSLILFYFYMIYKLDIIFISKNMDTRFIEEININFVILFL